jgi:hypothetical protein
MPVYVLVRLWIREGLEAEFEAYERKVSRIMARYGGVIEPHHQACGTRIQGISQALYDAYRADSERRALGDERVAAIAHTEVLVGTAGPTYKP